MICCKAFNFLNILGVTGVTRGLRFVVPVWEKSELLANGSYSTEG